MYKFYLIIFFIICSNKNILAEDCCDLYNAGSFDSDTYSLKTYNRKVECDMKTEYGGWLVILKRQKVAKQVDFNEDWASYKKGFGDLDTEFWIGNELLHNITNTKSYILRVDMVDRHKRPFYATYSEFRVENEESGYKLHVGGYEGNYTDRLSYHNNQKFSTYDVDNDAHTLGSCAKKYSGGFWYKQCYEAHLTGIFPNGHHMGSYKLMRWYKNSHDSVTSMTLSYVEMKIRPK